MSLPEKDVWPPALRNRDQWIQWCNVDGAKVPMQTRPKGKASSTDPDTWTSFYDAYNYFDEAARTGLGFVVSPEDPFVVYDLDHVVNEDGETATWALKLIENRDSLTYRSVSGTGYHIWMRSSEPLPGPALSIKWPSLPSTALEIFGEKRFLVMSGDLYLKRPIRDKTKQIHDLYNRIAAYKAAQRQAKANLNNPRFSGAPSSGNGATNITLRDWLDQYGVEYRTGHTSAADDGISYKIECPWGSEHTDEKNGIGHAAIFVKGGKWCFSCCHTHDYSWSDFRERVAPKQPGAEFKLSFGRRK